MMMTPLELAESQIGITEIPSGSNRVKYNDWYYGQKVSGSAYPWCMAFVQWCYAKSGNPLPYKTASCSALLNWYKSHNPACIVESQQPGDIVIYTFGHTGICANSAADYVVAIEGNTSLTSDDNGGAVMERTRNKSVVQAFIRPRVGSNTAVELPVLRKGITGTSVKALQLLLIGNRYNCGKWGADGDFGAATEDAVKKYQKGYSLTADGIVGSETWKSLLGVAK